MAKSYYGQKEEWLANHTRKRKLAAGILLTTDHGSWAHLTNEEYKELCSGNLEYSLKSMLKEKGIVVNDSNVNTIINDFREKCSYLFQGTSLHIVVPTLRCNLHCLYCHANSRGLKEKGYDMSPEVAKKTVDFIFQSPSKAITIEFQGGEPLVNFPMVKYIVEYAKEVNKKQGKNLKFSIVTNLTLMDEDKLKFLVDNSIGICTSLDGPEDVHNKNRGEYEKTVNWIKKIKSRGINLNAMLLVTKNSLGRMKEIVDEYSDLGFRLIWVKPVNKLGSGIEKWKEIGINDEEFLSFWKEGLDYCIHKGIIENSTAIILKKILLKECYNFADLQSPCGAAIAQLAYSQDGSIYTCDEARAYEIFKLGTVSDKYKDILCSREVKGIVQSSINDNPACEVCAYKPYCGVCPVCSYAERGNILSKLPDSRCRILKGMFDHIFEKMITDEEYRKAFLSWVE